MDGYIFVFIEYITFNVIDSITLVKLSIVLMSGSYIGFTNREKHVKCNLNISNFFTVLRMKVMLL